MVRHNPHVENLKVVTAIGYAVLAVTVLFTGCLPDIETHRPVGTVQERSMEVKEGHTLPIIRTQTHEIQITQPLNAAPGDTVWIGESSDAVLCTESGVIDRASDKCASVYQMNRTDSKMSVGK